MTVREIAWLKLAAVGACCLADFFRQVCDHANKGVRAAVDEYLCSCDADRDFLTGLCDPWQQSGGGHDHGTSAAPPAAAAPEAAGGHAAAAPGGTTSPRPAGK